MVENRTLFPATVVEITDRAPESILLPGAETGLLGETVSVGAFAGYALYGLALEERATCPASCEIRGACPGNDMRLLHRHRIGKASVYFDRLEAEIVLLLRRHRQGVLVHLHLLGDFPSIDYVEFWSEMLTVHPRLACFGTTRRLPTDDDGDGIGHAIDAVKEEHPNRFRIRWSWVEPIPDGAVTIREAPRGMSTPEGMTCPAQVDETAFCASCGLCWESGTRDEAIVFYRPVAHPVATAPPATKGELETSRRPLPPVVRGARAIAPIDMPPSVKPASVTMSGPAFRMAAPTALLVEEAYQRDLSPRSIKLIRKIVAGWDWAKFKPPVCAETADGLFVIDGQHTAIAAASHPNISEILVMVVEAPRVETRADAFVAHNRDRLAMSALQIFTAEVAAGSTEAVSVLKAITAGGGKIPRDTPMRGRTKPGEVVAIAAARRVHGAQGPEGLERLVRIAVSSGIAPINSTVVFGLQLLLGEPRFAEAARQPDKTLAAALGSFDDMDGVAQHYASAGGMNRYRACAVLVAKAALSPALVVAA